MNLFAKLFARSKSLAHPGGASCSPALLLPFRRYSLSDWQSAPERVSYVAALLRDPMFLDLLGMLANARPAAPRSLDATTATILYGQRLGYDQVITSLLAAGTPAPTPPTDVPADYDAANLMAAWERAGGMDE